VQIIRWDGQRISRPGIYAGIPLNDYHRGDICDGPSVSSSGLRTVWNESPAHFWNKCAFNPSREEDEPSEAFILGRAAHHLICGEPFFTRDFVLRPDRAPDGREWHGSNKTCREWLAEQKRLGKTVLTPEMVDSIRGMALALSENPLMQAGILNGLIEHSMFWRDRKTGIWLKARPDAIPSDSGDFSDFKTTTSVQYRDLQKSIGDFGYHQQGALVLDGARELRMEAASFTLVWCEKKRPHCVRIQSLRSEDVALGAKQNRWALDVIHECIQARNWPGPGDDRADAEFVDLADWKRTQIEERLKLNMREAA
jgi:hypothetical protein